MKMLTRRKDVGDGPANLKKMKLDDVDESSSSSSSSSSIHGFKAIELENSEYNSILSKLRHKIPEVSFEEISRDFKACSSLDSFRHRLFVVGSARKVNLRNPHPSYSNKKYSKYSLVIQGGTVPDFLSKSKMIVGSPDGKGYEDSLLLIRSVEKKLENEYVVVKDRQNVEEVIVDDGDIVLARLVPECSRDYKAWSFGWIRLISKSPESRNIDLDYADNEPGI
jgi:hypothetical protein